MMITILKEYVKVFETFCISSSTATEEEIRAMDEKILEVSNLTDASKEKEIWMRRWNIARSCLPVTI